MLNKPKYMVPSTNMQECTIDVNTDNIPFSCIVDGNEAVYAWRIKIYRLNDNVLVYDTGKIEYKENYTPTLPFFPVNEKNQNVVFKVNLANYSSIVESESNIFVNSLDTYYWSIEFWNNTDNISDKTGDSPTAKSCEETFYANTTPKIVRIAYKTKREDSYENTLSLDGLEATVFRTNEYSFKADYKQEENVPLKRYGWRIIDLDNSQVLLDTITENQIYGTADNIICSYDGFLNDGNYSIELYIETQNGATMTTDTICFSVSYKTTFLTNDFKTEVLKNESAIINSWGDANTIEGVSVGVINYKTNYPIVDGETSSIEIKKNSRIEYNYGSTSNLDVSEDTYIVLSLQLPNDEDTVLFIAEGTDNYGNALIRKLSYISGKFEYIVGNPNGAYEIREHRPNVGYEPCKYVWYVITMSPYLGRNTELIVIESRAINGLYPSATLYPSDSLYPSFGVWDKLKNEEVVDE